MSSSDNASSSSSSAGSNEQQKEQKTTTPQNEEPKQRITQEAIQNVAKYLPNEDKKRAEQEIVKDRKFWNNQPVPKICKFDLNMLLDL